MQRKSIAVILLLIALPVGYVLASLFSEGAQDMPEVVAQGEQVLTVEQLQEFPDFPVVWLGEEFQGLTLSHVKHVSSPASVLRPPVEFVVAIYGDCDPGTESEGGCPAPLAVFTDRPCFNKPSVLAKGARQGPPFEVRGAQAQWALSGHLFLYTGRSSIEVISTIGDEVALGAVNALAGANAPGLALAPGQSERLPPPVPEEVCLP